MQTSNLNIGTFNVNLVLDDDGHLSVFVNSTDGTSVIDITDDMGGEREVCFRLTSENIEQNHRCNRG